MNLNGNYSCDMKFNLSHLTLKKFIYLNETSTFLLLDTNGKIFSLYNPNVEKLENTEEMYISISEISIDIQIKDIMYIRDLLIILDQKDNLFYLPVTKIGECELSNIERNYANIIKKKK